jgi:hypothetical protein
MAQQYATGSCHLWLRFADGGGIQYFGTCESMPQDVRSPTYEMLMNDISGSQVPLDVAYQGEAAQISLTMTRWNETLAQSLETPPGPNSVPGSWSYSDVGTLMSLEDEWTEVWIGYTFGSALANKTVYTANGLRPGRHYLQSVLWSPQADETGTKPMKRHFMMYAFPYFDPTTKQFTLWDTDFSGISAQSIT